MYNNENVTTVNPVLSSNSLANRQSFSGGSEKRSKPAILRVFPRKNKATPDDRLTRFDGPNLLDFMAFDAGEFECVHVSVTFTADKPRAEKLAEVWSRVAPTYIGGVAYGDSSLEFIPGRYIKRGYTITSRGCPRKCWFCAVPKKWPTVNPLPIYDGWNVLDDNLLAAPEFHVRAVMDMLSRQNRRICFTGGLEALSLQDWHVDLMAQLKPRPTCYFAYDPGDAFETLESAARRMLAAGWTRESHRLLAYCLIGYPLDTFEKAEKRLRDLVKIGFTPYAMLWEPETPSAMKWKPTPDWRSFQRQWLRPAIIYANRKPA